MTQERVASFRAVLEDADDWTVDVNELQWAESILRDMGAGNEQEACQLAADVLRALILHVQP